MFGLFGNKNKMPSRVGAREKRMMARNIGGGNTINPKGKDAKETSPVAAILMILIISVALAYLLTEIYINNGAMRFSTGMSDIDNLLFKNNKPQFFGSPDLDYGVLIFIRGVAIFLAAGIWPLTALIVQRAMDNAQMNVFRLFWGTPIGLALFVIIVKDLIWPGLSAILGGMT